MSQDLDVESDERQSLMEMQEMTGVVDDDERRGYLMLNELLMSENEDVDFREKDDHLICKDGNEGSLDSMCVEIPILVKDSSEGS